MSIKIFVTGGTFDKEYDPILQVNLARETRVPEVLHVSRCVVPTAVEVLMQIDSREITDEMRESFAQKCADTPEEYIIFTHGTDTMVHTAEVLASKKMEKTIVLTGAMVPFRFRNSDAQFNLGAAVAFVQAMPHGVYIAMNGRCRAWNAVHKNLQTGVFE